MAGHNNDLSGYGKEMTPSVRHVKIYLSQKGFEESQIDLIVKTIVVRSWKTQTGRPIRNWKQYLFQWQRILQHALKKIKRRKH